MSEIIIRAATLEDFAALADLTTQLGYPTSSAEMRRGLQLILACTDYETYVAESSGPIVGMVGACVDYYL